MVFSVQGGFSRRKKRGEDGKIGKKLSDHKLNRHSDAEWVHLKRLDDGKSLIRPLLEKGELDLQHLADTLLEKCSFKCLVKR